MFRGVKNSPEMKQLGLLRIGSNGNIIKTGCDYDPIAAFNEDKDGANPAVVLTTLGHEELPG